MTFREDSRLLEYTRRDGDNAVTGLPALGPCQRSFSTIAQYRRSIERFCASVAPTVP